MGESLRVSIRSINRFKDVIRDFVRSDDFDSEHPGASFLRVFMLFKKIERYPIRSLSEEEHKIWVRCFLNTLSELGVEVKKRLLGFAVDKKSPKKKDLIPVTTKMMEGARKAECRHRAVLRDDY